MPAPVELPFTITSDLIRRGGSDLAKAIQGNFEHLVGVSSAGYRAAGDARDATRRVADHADRMEQNKIDRTNPAGADLADDDSIWGIGMNPPALYFSIITPVAGVAVDSGPVLGTWVKGANVQAVSPEHTYSFRADRPVIVFALALVQARQTTVVNFNFRLRITLEDVTGAVLKTSDSTGQFLPNDGAYREFVNFAKFQITPVSDTADLLLRWELQQDDAGAPSRLVDLGDRKLLVFAYYDPTAGNAANPPAWAHDAGTQDAYFHNG